MTERQRLNEKESDWKATQTERDREKTESELERGGQRETERDKE